MNSTPICFLCKVNTYVDKSEWGFYYCSQCDHTFKPKQNKTMKETEAKTKNTIYYCPDCKGGHELVQVSTVAKGTWKCKHCFGEFSPSYKNKTTTLMNRKEVIYNCPNCRGAATLTDADPPMVRCPNCAPRLWDISSCTVREEREHYQPATKEQILQSTEDPVEPVPMHLEEGGFIDAEVTEVQEEGKKPIRIKGRGEIEVTPEDKLAFYLDAIKKHERIIENSKQEIKNYRSRYSKLAKFLANEQRRREQAAIKASQL